MGFAVLEGLSEARRRVVGVINQRVSLTTMNLVHKIFKLQ